MWAFSRAACRLLAVSGFCFIAPIGHVQADGTNFQNNSQFGLSLPYASVPNGQDEIRTADGTSCRSAVGGDGTYFDSGVIGTPGGGDVNATAAVYGRLVVPIGSKSKRLDCSKLYDLEIQRLKMELQLVRMGLSGSPAAPNTNQASNSWENEGWSNVTPTASVAETPPAPVKKPKKPAGAAVQVIESIY